MRKLSINRGRGAHILASKSWMKTEQQLLRYITLSTDQEISGSLERENRKKRNISLLTYNRSEK